MTTKKTKVTTKFSDQYKDPRWQKKRLYILEKDKFTCRKCGDKESTLHVHHTQYIKDHKVWEYRDDQLITLCDTCHEGVHKLSDEIKNLTANCVTNYRFYETDMLKKLNDFLMAIYVSGPSDPGVEHIFSAIDLFWTTAEEYSEIRSEYEVYSK